MVAACDAPNVHGSPRLFEDPSTSRRHFFPALRLARKVYSIVTCDICTSRLSFAFAVFGGFISIYRAEVHIMPELSPVLLGGASRVSCATTVQLQAPIRGRPGCVAAPWRSDTLK
jgi:hypothetical protein